MSASALAPSWAFRASVQILSESGLAALHRWGHPGQQQGRRIPWCILSIPTSIRRLRVASCFADVTQQIHSLRASGVKSGQRLLAVASDAIAFRKSAGSL